VLLMFSVPHPRGIIGKCCVVILSRKLGIKAQIELVFPPEFKMRLGKSVLAQLRTG